MRIAYDARPLIEPTTGIGRYVRSLLEALLGCPEVQEILLCSPRKIETGSVLGRDPRVRERIQLGWKGNIWLQAFIPLFLEKCKPDLFHATLFLTPLLARCPSVVNIYDLTAYRYPGTMEAKNRWLLRVLIPRAVSRAEKIITLSEFTRQEIGERWPQASHKIVVVPGAPYVSTELQPGVSKVQDPDRILSQYGVQRPYLLYVGTLEPRKNIVRMLRAFELLNQMGTRGVQLVLVGSEGWGFKEFRQAWQSSPVRHAIRYIGYVPDTVLGILYRHADVFLYLSLYEGFGLPPLEAMAAGTCVVASNRASLPECLGDAAVLAEPFDTEAVANAVSRLLEDEGLRMDYVRRGLQRAGIYSWRKSAEKTLAVYREFA
jgi:glycosyltransferase involved in cell wall biosynthesis